MKKLINLFRSCFGNPINNNKPTPKYERKTFNEKDLKSFNQNIRLYDSQAINDKIKRDIDNGLIITGSYVPTIHKQDIIFCSGLVLDKLDLTKIQ